MCKTPPKCGVRSRRRGEAYGDSIVPAAGHTEVAAAAAAAAAVVAAVAAAAGTAGVEEGYGLARNSEVGESRQTYCSDILECARIAVQGHEAARGKRADGSAQDSRKSSAVSMAREGCN